MTRQASMYPNLVMKFENEATKIPRTVQKQFLSCRQQMFWSSKGFLVSEGSITKVLISWCLIYYEISYKLVSYI